MCLILFAHQIAPDLPLVVAANRDEFFARPSDDADFWPDSPPQARVLAGRDLRAGGTWLGMTMNGRFAAVTNIRDPSQTQSRARSRGELTLNFLQGDASPAQYSQLIQSQFDDFAGFNLLLGDRDSLFYLNNQHRLVTPLQPGVYGLSNGLLDASWPKIVQGRARLQGLLEPGLSTDQLITLMSDKAVAPDHELPDTGVDKALERQLSAAFIQNPEREYGTRCSTAIILDSNNQCRFSEQNYNNAGAATSAHYFQFTLSRC